MLVLHGGKIGMENQHNLNVFFYKLVSDFIPFLSAKWLIVFKVSKGAKIRNRYNQVPHLTQDTNGKVTNSQ